MADPASDTNGPQSDHSQAGAPPGAPAAAGRGAADPVVALRNLSKSFGGARALDGVDLTVMPEEVHGLLGENGSGKSTLIKVLAGYHAPDSGTLEVNGQDVPLPLAPGQFRQLGLSFVHQDLGLIVELTALENLRMVELAASSSWRIRWGRERRRAREAFERYGVAIRPDALVSDLSETDRARLAIVRALEDIRRAQREGRGLLILDEPTVFLSKDGTEDLFRLIRDVVANHASVLFVSHDLDEVREITDRVTVLRDGRMHGTVVTKEANEGELVEMIIGRRLAALVPQHDDTAGRTVDASVSELAGRQLRGISFQVHRGEVLGVTGLLGSGFEDVPYLLFGAKPCFGGEFELDGSRHNLRAMTPARALAANVTLLPGDRQREGSVGSMSVGDNVMLQVLDRYRPLRLQRRRMRRDAASRLTEFDVRPADPALAYQSLSGGNQQKALLAKWLQTEPRLLLLHEPTQGVDIGAREQIFEMLTAAAGEGMSILCASSDYEQLAQICDRVLVIGRGRIVRELTGEEITKDRIAEQVYDSVGAAGASISTG
jgi:ribose transport system ATP-binding protein